MHEAGASSPIVHHNALAVRSLLFVDVLAGLQVACRGTDAQNDPICENTRRPTQGRLTIAQRPRNAGARARRGAPGVPSSALTLGTSLCWPLADETTRRPEPCPAEARVCAERRLHDASEDKPVRAVKTTAAASNYLPRPESLQ